jgi:DNA-binding response OmpR family regulator
MMDVRHTLLLVEDDQKLATTLRRGFSEQGIVVTVANCAEAARGALERERFDVVVLDLGLPDQDGIDLLQSLRQSGFSAPVLILTARDRVDERILGLDAGGDDYLSKPFAFSELLARIRALLRRSEKAALPVLQVGDLTVDLLNREARRAGKDLQLTPREFDVLAYLAHHAGSPVARDTLSRDIWKIKSRATSMDNVIDVLMARLREKVDKDFDQRLLTTVRGVGYKLQVPHE